MSDRARAELAASWLEGRPRGPFSLQLNPTMACNLNCLFCRRQDQLPEFFRSHRELSDEKYEEIVRDAIALGVKSINIKGGGEPLIRRRLLMRLIPMIKGAGAGGSLITNATLLDDALAEAFVRHGWDEIAVSLDGPDAETHDYLRDKPGTFDRAMAGVERVVARKRARGARAPHLKFHCVLTNRVAGSVDGMLRLAAERGVEEFELDSLNPHEPSGRHLALEAEGVEAFQKRLPEWTDLAGRLGLRHNLEDFRRRDYALRDPAPPPGAPAPGAIPCYFPWHHCSITPEGSIVPCCYGEGFRSRGSLHELSFREAWLNGGMSEYRDSMLDGTMKPFCAGCTAGYKDRNERVRAILAEEARA